MNNKKLSKRLQVDKNKTTIFIFVSIAAAITVASVMISRALWAQASYTARVVEQKEIARDQLEANKVAVAALTDAYNKFDDQSPNLLGGSPDGTGPRDGTNSTLVLDALPNTYDFPALVTSIEKLLGGYSIGSISGTDDALAQQAAAGGAPVEIPFNFTVSTNYDGLKNLISTFDKSIRPFKFQTLNMSGTNGSLDVSASMSTYFQPETGVQITEQQVQ